MSNPTPPFIATNQSDSYLPALDGLRALAILLVIPHNSDNFGLHPGIFLPFAILAHAGWIGVQLFFVLSGYLITRNLIALRPTKNYFTTFFGRRVLRIFPLYFGTLICGLLLLPQLIELSPTTLSSHTHQVWLWTFLSNWTQPFGRGVEGFSHFWSLAVEEQFYLVWPFAVLACTTARLRTLCAALIVIAFLIRLGCVYYDVRPEVPYMFTVCRMDALAFGALVATFTTNVQAIHWPRARYDRVIFSAVAALVVTSLCTHLFSTYDRGTLTIGQTILSAAVAAIVGVIVLLHRAGSTHWLLKILSTAPLRSIGKVSFAMYVFHLPIAIAIKPMLARYLTPTSTYFGIANTSLVIVASYLAAFASYHLLEKHFLRLKKYFVSNAQAAPSHAG
jgi:peptidoglycan/LPS O-acetylase OafA/YrhL